MKRWQRFLADPEWRNYRRWVYRQGPVVAAYALFRLGFACLTLVGRRLWEASAYRWGRTRARDFAAEVNSSEVASKGHYFFSTDEIPGLVQYAQANLRDDVGRVCADAAGILEATFRWTEGAELRFDREIPWRGPYADIEQLFWLNRWYFGVTLAKAYAFTHLPAYVERFAELLAEWIRENPVAVTSPVWESYSVSERIVNWIFVHHLLSGQEVYRAKCAERVRAQLAVHARHLLDNLEERHAHNHLINNARALYTYGVVHPDLALAETAHRVGWSLLEREIGRQFRDDGMLGEQSTHYHLLLLSRYAEVTLLALRNGQAVSEPWLTRLRRMFAVGNLFVRPDETLVTVGDVSPDAPPRTVVGALAVGTMFGVPTHVELTENALWLLGRDGVGAARPRVLDSQTELLEHSGYVVQHEQDLHLVMQCDPLATVIRHGHQDPLGIDVWLGRHWVFGDMGNCSFQGDRWDDFFRGPYAHSAIVVDGMPPYVRGATMRSLLPQDYWRARAGIKLNSNSEGTTSLIAWHTGYDRLADPVRLEREVRRRGRLSVAIMDRVESEGSHEIEVLFQIGQNRAELADSDAVELLDSSGRRIARLRFSSASRIRLELRTGMESPNIAGWRSPCYGVRDRATTVACCAQVRGEFRLETCVESLSG